MKTASWDVWTKSNNHWWCKINLKMYLLFFFTSVVLSVGVALHPFLWPNVCVTHEKNSSKIKKIRKLVPDMIFYFLSLVPCLVAFEEWEKKFMYSCRAWILLFFLVSFMKWEKKKYIFVLFLCHAGCVVPNLKLFVKNGVTWEMWWYKLIELVTWIKEKHWCHNSFFFLIWCNTTFFVSHEIKKKQLMSKAWVPDYYSFFFLIIPKTKWCHEFFFLFGVI